MMRKPALVTALAMAVLFALTACVGIPGGGSVTQGLAISDDTGGSDVVFNPDGPAKGANQLDILDGFIRAFTSSTGGYSVAKQFLTNSFGEKWDPRTTVLVRSGTPSFYAVDASTMSYTFKSIATVDSNGAYTEATQSSTLTYGFTKVAGQWRISSGPSGIVLSDQTFERIFQQHPIYFLDPTSEHLVPDLRWFANGTAPTRIVSALLQGPSDWLKSAVRTEFPDGTVLSDSGSVVTVDSGVAHVDLTKEALGATARGRQLMRLQLFESLRSVPSILSVSIFVEGTLLPIEDLSNPPQADSKVNNQALVSQKQKNFGFYSSGKIAGIPTIGARVEALKPEAATLSSDQGSVAVLGDAGVSVVRGSVSQLLDTRDELIAPSLDEYGYVWSVPSDDPNAIIAYDSEGGAHSVAPSLPPDAQIMSLEVSRDGARVAILLSTATGARLIVAAILRDQDQKQFPQVPVSLGPTIVDKQLDSGTAVDATWVDQFTVGTLVASDDLSTVQLFDIGGQSMALGTLPNAATEIVGGNGGSAGLRVLGGDGAIWTYSGSSWQSSTVIVDFIANQR